jgi:hypothetical protein
VMGHVGSVIRGIIMIVYSKVRGSLGRQTGAAQVTSAQSERKLPPVSDRLILSDPLEF